MSFDYKRLVKFEHNIGDKDKKVRMVSGVVLLSVSLFTASVLMLLVGLALVATSYSGWCPAYSGFGKNTLSGGFGASDANAGGDSH
ncbi:YgaP family membrane protein [Methylomonas koyamae]|uniref:YgaP family membrane protein n=1 Tax=Methylomonas koyamae TaxID=702114 RepID=UPI0006D11A7B|nr:DUF2892 domain-containing protein [Methylomonas koyamae]BBL59421.1 hypothetical protein MKFW12EY_30340 [Methylomonas koyamae]